MGNETGRPTIAVKTPIGGKEIVLKEWITGRESEYIEEPIMAGMAMKATVSAGKPAAEIDKFDMGSVSKSNERKIESVVMSIDGNPDDIVNRIRDMRKGDYDFVMAKIEEIISQDDKKKADLGTKSES